MLRLLSMQVLLFRLLAYNRNIDTNPPMRERRNPATFYAKLPEIFHARPSGVGSLNRSAPTSTADPYRIKPSEHPVLVLTMENSGPT